MDSDSALSMPTAASLWAKLFRDDCKRITGWHSLVDHSADVAAVVSALLVQPTINQRLAHAAGRLALDGVTCARLAALAFLHDIGKANRGFRRRVDPRAPLVGHIDQLAWLFNDPLGERLSTILGIDRMAGWFASDAAMELWDCIFAHHGRPWARDPSDAGRHWRPDASGSDPIADLAPMRTSLDAWFQPAFLPGPPLPDEPAFHHAFAGLLMLADWLGSDTNIFPPAHGRAVNRMTQALRAADRALPEIGLAVEPRRAAVRQRALDFAATFGNTEPRPIQRDAVLPDARCVVLEAETGSGKTEAALWRFHHLFTVGAVDGLYFALPTRVAATQMFARVKRFRDAVFPPEDRPAVVLAVPGQVGADDARGYRLPDFAFEWDDQADATARRARWAAEHPKRFLAAQIAVGTIDQALLGAIATRHAHMRAACLLRHLLVVDEVHASDRYMETLLGNLLRGHLQAGGHALLLSATLGGGMRSRMLGTTCPPLAAAEAVPYPALSWAEAGAIRVRKVAAAGAAKAIAIEPMPAIGDPAAIAELAQEAAARGARVLVIRNTVRDAVATAQALEALAGPAHPALFRVGGVPTLHHGRFAPSDRLLLDAAVEADFGRRGAADLRVVIGTQTLEVSLDLDADLLITDLCPVDVLLQRMGRLHRHADRVRPVGFARPRAVVLTPQERDLLPLLRSGGGRHGLGRVYEDARVLEATWRMIETIQTWKIPDNSRLLVERTTHPERLAAIEEELRGRNRAWAGVIDDGYKKTLGAGGQAVLALLDRGAPFSRFLPDPDDHFATRLGAKDMLAQLPHPVPGPFGAVLSTLKVPHFLAPEGAGDAVAEVIEHTTDGLVFRLGAALLRYDRFGLARHTG